MAKTEAKREEMVETSPGAMARPSFISKGDVRGTESIERDDIQMPRLCVAQSLSPELNPKDSKFIDGLRNGDLFNNLTGQVYGSGPIEVAFVRRDSPRGVEFVPRSQGGGIKDFNVPLDDPRMQFTVDAAGKRVKPVATKFYDYIAAILPLDPASPMSSLAALSFKSSGLKMARRLNMLVKLRGGPLFAGKYTLTTAMESNAQGTFAVIQVRNSSTIDSATSVAGWVSEDTYKALESIFESIKDKEIKIDREPGDEADEELAADM